MTIRSKNEKLTVLHVATLNQPIRSNLGYGPIETVLYNIDRGLHSAGHRSIVACSGDSRVTGEHYITVDQSIGDYWSNNTPERRKTMHMHLSRALGRATMGDIDIIHTHDAKTVEYLYNSTIRMHVPIVMTLHVSAKESMLEEAYRHWCNPVTSPMLYCSAISNYQKNQYHSLINVEDVVYHGIDVDGFPVKETPDEGRYLFTIGRITPDKGQDKAIELAKRTGSKLIIAGCVQNKVADREYFAILKNSIDLSVDVGQYPVDSDYYATVIQPILECDKQIIYIGEINSEHKKQWYRHARACVFPIQWGEPFGLVMIESMACGTPVIAFNRGAVPEIIVDGKTGFVVDSMHDMIEAVGCIDSIDHGVCRRHVRNNFSIKNMAHTYSEIYHRIINRHQTSKRRSSEVYSNISTSLNHGPVAI
jgi:glycosyltransferase involved in cell wall biosynthesis